jgi:peptidoglycan hydrolase-like protein with peptidoglycan-binding domain
MAINRSVGRGGVNRKDDVEKVQRALNMSIPPSDYGICGPKTRKAIADFQRANGLAVDGRIDPGFQTAAKLFGGGGTAPTSSDSGSTAAPSAAPAPVPTATPIAISGSVGAGGANNTGDVKMVQRALGLPATGTCDAATIEAIRNFQRGQGFAVADGRIDVGRNTAKALGAKAGASRPSFHL